jgi:hypothetical protein
MDGMNLRPDGRRTLRAPLVAALLTYSVLLVGSAVLHHDFACHQTSRTHCTACTWAQMSSGIESDTPPGTSQLPPAGDLYGVRVTAPDTLLTSPAPGRSPPQL